jgi:hypothetical protein
MVEKAHSKTTNLFYYEEKFCAGDMLAVFGKCTEGSYKDPPMNVVEPVHPADINNNFIIEHKFKEKLIKCLRESVENGAIFATLREDAIKKETVGVLPDGYAPNSFVVPAKG